METEQRSWSNSAEPSSDIEWISDSEHDEAFALSHAPDQDQEQHKSKKDLMASYDLASLASLPKVKPSPRRTTRRRAVSSPIKVQHGTDKEGARSRSTGYVGIAAWSYSMLKEIPVLAEDVESIESMEYDAQLYAAQVNKKVVCATQTARKALRASRRKHKCEESMARASLEQQGVAHAVLHETIQDMHTCHADALKQLETHQHADIVMQCSENIDELEQQGAQDANGSSPLHAGM